MGKCQNYKWEGQNCKWTWTFVKYCGLLRHMWNLWGKEDTNVISPNNEGLICRNPILKRNEFWAFAYVSTIWNYHFNPNAFIHSSSFCSYSIWKRILIFFLFIFLLSFAFFFFQFFFFYCFLLVLHCCLLHLLLLPFFSTFFSSYLVFLLCFSSYSFCSFFSPVFVLQFFHEKNLLLYLMRN